MRDEGWWCVDAHLIDNNITAMAMRNDETKQYAYCTKKEREPIIIQEVFKNMDSLWSYYRCH